MRIQHILLAVTLFPLIAFAQTSKPAGAPTLAEAQAFMDRAEADLLELGNEAAQAGWVQATYITDDTEALSAKANERLLTKTNEIVIGARQFNGMKLPPDLARKLMLLRLNGTPTDPKLVAELTKVSTSLDGMYGKGKYCRPGSSGAAATSTEGEGEHCLGIEEIDVLMAKSRDPKELLELWQGWHKISPPMREKYARLVELSNQGAREFGFKDTGDLWRSGYDMKPEEFSAELERTWKQLEPLYQELHAYVRFKLIQKYGAAATRPDGMIPADLLGNMWAQEWGNIYDVVAPAQTPGSFKMYDLEGALNKQIGAVPPMEAGKKMARYGEGFFTSLGFAPLPATFWERSQFIKPRDRDVICHAGLPEAAVPVPRWGE